jgi:anaerobic selenocysteine-containing dehydrogenase
MHRQFIHSQLGEVNVPAQEDFDYVYMHPRDISALSLKEGDRVVITSGTTKIPYLLSPDPNLLPGTAMVYSGGPSKADGLRNANFFTPGTPESLGGSGSYNAGRIRIFKG